MVDIEEMFVDLVVQCCHSGEVLSEAAQLSVQRLVLVVQFIYLVRKHDILYRVRMYLSDEKIAFLFKLFEDGDHASDFCLGPIHILL